MISAPLRLCADSSPARVHAVPSHGSPGRSPCRTIDQPAASRSCRRNLDLSASALPSEYEAFGHDPDEQWVVPSLAANTSQAALSGRESRAPRTPGVMCSPFRQLLTSSSPDIHTLHSVLIKLHRSEATTADLTHSGQSIGLLYSLAADTTAANADSADMATAILASLATSPAARCQLPVRAREQLTDVLVSLVNADARADHCTSAATEQSYQAVQPDFMYSSPPTTSEEAHLDNFSVHGILHTDLPPPVSPTQSLHTSGDVAASASAFAQAVAEDHARERDELLGSTTPPAPVVTELPDSAYEPQSSRRQPAPCSPGREAGSRQDHIPCPEPSDPSGESPTPAVLRKMAARTSAFLRASTSPPTSAAVSAVSLAAAATRVSDVPASAVRTMPRAAPRAAAAPSSAPAVVTAPAAAVAEPPPPPPPPPCPSHSLRDSESDAAAVTAVSVFLSKCGLVRSSLSRATPLAGVLSSSNALPDVSSGQRAAEVEEEVRRAGRRSAAALALGAAAAADEAMLRHLHGHNIPQMLQRWLSGGDDVIALTALLVYLALAEAPLHHTASPPASIIPRPMAPRTPRRSSPGTAQPPPLLTPALVEEITACCARLLSRRAAPFTRSVAFTAVAAVGSDAACMPCIDTDSTGVDVSMRDALVAGLAHAGFCGTSAPSCQALLAPLTPVFYHEGTAVRTVAHSAATAVATLAHRSDDELLRFVEAGAVPGLRRLLECGGRDECAAAAAALAELARHPSAHTLLLSSGTCSTLTTYAGSQDPELQECQAGIALALARLSLNAATQFTLIGGGLAAAIARMIAHAPSACMPAVSTVVMAVVAEGNSQGAVLVRAGVVRELVAFLRCHTPCAHLRSAHAALHSLLVHAHIDAAAAALHAGAVPHLVFALSSSDSHTRKRCARMLALLIEASPVAAATALERLECVPALLKVLRAPDLPERAEAVDILYLLRRSPATLEGLAEAGALRGLVAILEALVHLEPHYALRRAAAAARRASAGVDRRHVRGGTAATDGGENGAGSRFVVVDRSGVPVRRRRTRGASGDGLSAAEHGMFRSTVAAGTTVDRQAVVGKVVRLLLAMAVQQGKAAAAVAGCEGLPPLLARLVARSAARQRTVSPMLLLQPLPLPQEGGDDAATASDAVDEDLQGGVTDNVQREVADFMRPGSEAGSGVFDEPLPWERVEFLNHDDARDGPLPTVSGASTYDAAELLLSFIHDAGALPRSAVLEPLVAQAWLGNNVDLLHTAAVSPLATDPEAEGPPAAAADEPQRTDEPEGP